MRRELTFANKTFKALALGVLGVTLSLMSADTASAQQNLFIKSLTPLQNVPVRLDSKTLNMPIAAPQQRSLPGRLSDLFLGGFRGLNNSRTPPVTNFPKAREMPGADYLKAFKYGRGVSVMP